MKYLKILDNTFLFDVVQDPMERANLKERHKDVYDRLVAEWNEWNTAMLPLDPQSFTDGFTGDELPDHFRQHDFDRARRQFQPPTPVSREN